VLANRLAKLGDLLFGCLFVHFGILRDGNCTTCENQPILDSVAMLKVGIQGSIIYYVNFQQFQV
jgi:hypothetical protein